MRREGVSRRAPRGGAWVAGIAALTFGAREGLAVSQPPSWTQSPIAAPAMGYYLSTPCLAFDHYGTPSVSWSTVANPSGTNTVKLSRLSGLGFWSTQDVATGTNIALVTSLAFDRAERPAVAWVNAAGNISASFNGGTVQNFGSGASTTNPAMRIGYDLAGALRGAYSRSTTGNFFDISHSGGTFASQDMTTVSGVTLVRDAAMAAGGNGLRHVAARASLSGGGEGVVVSSEVGGGPWAQGIIATASGIDGVDIAMDPTDGRMAVAYSTFDSGTNTSKLFYGKFTGFSLETTQVASSMVDRLGDVSLAFDRSDGQPAIAYELKVTAGPTDELWFAYRDPGQTWNTGRVYDNISMSASGGKPRKPSLAFDDYGTSWPAIAYIDGDGALAVAFDPPVPEPAAAVMMCAALIMGRRFGRAGRR